MVNTGPAGPRPTAPGPKVAKPNGPRLTEPGPRPTAAGPGPEGPGPQFPGPLGQGRWSHRQRTQAQWAQANGPAWSAHAAPPSPASPEARGLGKCQKTSPATLQ